MEPDTADRRIVAGRYEVLETLHTGQDGEVLAVRDLVHPDRAVVCKRVTGRGASSPRAARLEHEYRLLSSLRHPGLPRARDFGYDLGTDSTVLICDRAPGQTLEAHAPLAVDEVVAVAVDLCRALNLLHSRSWLHLDVKPRNVLWDRASGRTTLVDLDLAAFPESAVGRGTPPYASREAMGAGPVPDGRSDLFSLGVTLTEILTGRPASTDRPAEELDPGDVAPRWLRDLIRELTDPDPENRPADARAVIHRLRECGTRWPEESLATRTAILSHPPFSGRRSELDSILEALPPQTRRRGRRPVVVLQGEPGVGRSRLVEEAAREWRVAGINVLRVEPAPSPVGTLQPIHTLLDRLRRLAGAVTDEDSADSRERLGRLNRLTNSVLGLVRRRRTVLVLEDVDQYDRPSRDFLLHFLRRLTHEVWETGRAPVELVMTFRSDVPIDDGLRTYLESESVSGHFLELALAPLDLRYTGELLRGLVAPEPTPSALLSEVHERTGGVPLFVNETLRAHPLHGHGSGTLLGRLATESPREGKVPRSLEAVVRSRLLVCPAELRGVLEWLAIFPGGAETSLLSRVVADVDDVPAALSRLEQTGYARVSGTRWSMPSAISQEVVLGGVPGDRRAALHDTAAEVLATTEEPAHEAVWHQLRGTQPQEGLGRAWDVVADLLAERSEEEAVRLLEEVVAVSESSAFACRWATLKLADLHLERGQLRQARQRLAGLFENARLLDPQVVRRLARLHHREGNLGTAHSTMERLLALDAELSDADRLDLLLDLAEMLLSSGRHADAREIVARTEPLVAPHVPLDKLAQVSGPLEDLRAPRLAWPGDLAPLVARYLALRGDLARHDGEPGVGLQCHLATMKLRSRLGDLVGLGRALHGIGTIFMAEGESDLAERYFGRALHLRAEVGDLAGQADSANNMGVLLRKVGRTAEAIDHYRTSLRIRRQIGHTAGEGFSYINIARVYYERRELDAAVKYYDRALQVARRLSDARSQAQVLNALGAVAHLHDRFEAAIRHYEEAERLDRMVGNLKGALVKRLNLAAEYIRVGQLERGDQLVQTVARVTRRRGDRDLDGWLRLLAGRLHLAAGRHDAARESLALAAHDAATTNDREFAAEVGIARAEVELRAGRGSHALGVLPSDGGGLSREATARVAIVRARALLLGAGDDRHGVEAQVEEGERFARRARMTGLEWQCARCRGALRAAVEDRSQSLASYATALEALESVLEGLIDSELLSGFIASHDVQSFIEEVDELASGLAKSERSMLPGVAGALVRRVRDSLFEARRQVGLQEGVSRKNEEMMRRILEISRALRSTAPLDDLFREIVDGVVEFSGAERAFLLTVDERGRIRIPVARSREREPISEPQQQVSRRIVSEVLEKARSMRITDAGGAYAKAESVVNLDLRSIMCAPMMRGSMVVGMLYVDNRSRAGQFTGADQELLDIFAAQAAIALENARLVREFARDEKIRVMGNLAGGVAHDFNNLLTAILGRAQQMAELTDDDRIRGGLDTIMKAAQDGSVVVSRLQEFTRTRREGTFRSVNLGEVITDVLEFTRTRWEGDALRRGQRIEIVREVPSHVWVLGNLAEVREVFTNLVLNSVAAMPEGGALTIRVSVENERVETVVEDTGQGMTEEARESIFDPYFTTRGSEGSGLGMSIVYNIVLRHEGTIRVESAPGEGTRVVVSLPLAEPMEHSDEPVEPDMVIESGRRVLVVEDEDGVRELLQDVLDAAGFDVEAAPGGPEALESFRARPADVVITDLGMVPMTGWDVAREVKRLDPLTPVILITGWGGEIDQATAQRNQVDLLLNKPFDLKQVVASVKEAVHRRDAAVGQPEGR